MADTTPPTDPNAETITIQVWVGERLSEFSVNPETMTCIRNKANVQWPKDQVPAGDEQLVEAFISGLIEGELDSIGDDWRHA
jgi:hypothetical protein